MDQERIEVETGKVKWFNIAKGYGFIIADNDRMDLFIHYQNIMGTGFKKLTAGDMVQFSRKENEKGWTAVDVAVLNKVPGT